MAGGPKHSAVVVTPRVQIAGGDRAGKRKVSGFDSRGGGAAGQMESFVDIIGLNYKEAMVEFLQHLSDLWVFVVQRNAVLAPPAPRSTLYAERDVANRRVLVGWENYPSGAEGAARRFAPIRWEWQQEVNNSLRVFFQPATLESGLRYNVRAQRLKMQVERGIEMFARQGNRTDKMDGGGAGRQIGRVTGRKI